MNQTATRPEVTLQSTEQIDELYSFYENYEPRRWVAPLAYRAMARIFKPDATFEPATGLVLPGEGNTWVFDQAELSMETGALQQIGEDLRDGVSYIVINNHQPNTFGQAHILLEAGAHSIEKSFGVKTTLDQYVVAGLMACFEQTLPFVGNTYVWSKHPLFNKSRASRNFIDDMRALPLFSKRNLPRDPETGEIDKELVILQEYSVDRVIEASAKLHNKGLHGAIWPEGTRNDEDATQIQKVQKGIAQLIGQIDPSIDVRILSVLTDYGTPGFMPHIRPRVLLRKPLQVDRYDQAGIIEAVQDNLQVGLDALMDRRA